MTYTYRMVQIPPSISVKEDKGDQAAAYLQEIVNSQAKRGWEFYRVDSIGIREAPGCLAALFGARESIVTYYVVTFRREATAQNLG